MVKLSAFADVLREVETTLEPHRLCNYLYELAGAYTTFYEACPVLKAPDDETRRSRLALCALTAGDARDRPRPARHHRAGADVSSSTRAPSRRFSSSSRHARSTPPVTVKPGWRWSSTCSTSIATPA